MTIKRVVNTYKNHQHKEYNMSGGGKSRGGVGPFKGKSQGSDITQFILDAKAKDRSKRTGLESVFLHVTGADKLNGKKSTSAPTASPANASQLDRAEIGDDSASLLGNTGEKKKKRRGLLTASAAPQKKTLLGN
jgi:hypothetical protein